MVEQIEHDEKEKPYKSGLKFPSFLELESARKSYKQGEKRMIF